MIFFIDLIKTIYCRKYNNYLSFYKRAIPFVIYSKMNDLI